MRWNGLFSKIIVVLCLGMLSACNTTSLAGERIAVGTAVGATTGTVATVITGGCIPCGAAIGAGAGAGAGYIYHFFNRKPGR